MKKAFGRVLFVFVMVIVFVFINVSCSIAPKATKVSETLVAPVIKAYSKPLICENIDPNVSYVFYDETGNGTTITSECQDTDGYIVFTTSENKTILTRIFADTYRPMEQQQVLIHWDIDEVEPGDHTALVQRYNFCLVSIGDDLRAIQDESSLTVNVNTVTHVTVSCSGPDATYDSITANFDIKPVASVSLPQPKYNEDIKLWNELKAGEDVVFCAPLGSGWINVYPSSARYVGWDEPLFSMTSGCFPAKVLDPETGSIQYTGTASYHDLVNGTVYLMNREEVAGAYTFIQADQLVLGKTYSLCQVDGIHNPRIDSLTNVWQYDICVSGFYQGRSSDTKTSFWTIHNQRYDVVNLDGAYAMP